MKRTALSLCIIVALLTGCWDVIDIEDRGYIIGTAIDLKERKGEGAYSLALTNQFVIPGNMTSAPGEGGGGSKPFTNITVDGESLMIINRKMGAESSRLPFYGHLKMLVVSEDIAKEKDLFAGVLDLFIRMQEMRRDIKLIIAEEEAKDVLSVEPDIEKIPALYLDALSENSSKTMSMLAPVTVGDVHGFLLNHHSYALPMLKKKVDKLVQYEGAAVFSGKGNKLVGSLNDQETKSLNLVTKPFKGGTIEFEMDGHPSVYELEFSKPDIKVKTKDPQSISVEVSVTTEGSMAEMFGSKSLINEKEISKIRTILTKKLEDQINALINKLQHELNADLIGVNSVLEQKHPDIWKQIKDDWEQGEDLFSQVDIKVKATAHIQSVGASDRASDGGGKE
ncbi:Ger(x)C family spore germination protein [Lentibacillus saliphilus]|uniref:Ger(x)C family spore germination protein n=1 Tax=Lentibacillus saliphilus TaxID=2737028 RepID=UPI001C2F5BD9